MSPLMESFDGQNIQLVPWFQSSVPVSVPRVLINRLSPLHRSYKILTALSIDACLSHTPHTFRSSPNRFSPFLTSGMAWQMLRSGTGSGTLT